MERKIGEIFKYNGEWYQCLKSASCDECAFLNSNCIDNPRLICSVDDRTDNYSVIFKKLEKVGEPTIIMGKMVQEFKNNNNNHCEYCCFNKDCHPLKIASICDLHNSFFVELKQNKEDMEENKLNLKPFNLEAAKSGKPIYTRDGRKARIICFDAKGDKPIIALVEMGTAETPNNYPIDGKAVSAKEASCDLMMLPEKKEGWVNVYNADTTFYFVEGMVYDTKEEAIKHINPDNEIYITTVKVQWEE